MSAEIFRQSIEIPSDRVIVALDNLTWDQATEVMKEVGPHVGMGKGNSIAQKKGWEHAVNNISECGAETMLDQKYKDIPSTMENHLREATECWPRFITIFADNKPAALAGAVIGRDIGRENLYSTPRGHELGRMGIEGVGGILGVTVLTSLNDKECISIYGANRKKKVLQFAGAALSAGIDGIVCSGKELRDIRRYKAFDKLLTVVPGITPGWAQKAEDQESVVTPRQAIDDGADYIVVGRAIVKPPEGITRAEAAQRIAQELAEAS